MYNYLLTDLETSGFSPGKDRALSISYLLLSENLEVKTAGNYFIYTPNLEISKDAVAVHHLDEEFLRKHGVPLEEVCDKTYPLFQRALLLGHNIEFDARFLKQDFARAQYDLYFTELVDTMKSTAEECGIVKYKKNGEPSDSFKWPKLHEACDHFGVTDAMVKSLYDRYFGDMNIPLNLTFHSSAYDVSATLAMMLRGGWSCVRKYYHINGA